MKTFKEVINEEANIPVNDVDFPNLFNLIEKEINQLISNYEDIDKRRQSVSIDKNEDEKVIAHYKDIDNPKLRDDITKQILTIKQKLNIK